MPRIAPGQPSDRSLLEHFGRRQLRSFDTGLASLASFDLFLLLSLRSALLSVVQGCGCVRSGRLSPCWRSVPVLRVVRPPEGELNFLPKGFRGRCRAWSGSGEGGRTWAGMGLRWRWVLGWLSTRHWPTHGRRGAVSSGLGVWPLCDSLLRVWAACWGGGYAGGTITSVSPSSGSLLGGQLVTIAGTDLCTNVSASLNVTLDGVLALDVNATGCPDWITVTAAPTTSSVAMDQGIVRVSANDSVSVSAAGAWTYYDRTCAPGALDSAAICVFLGLR